MSFFDIEKRRNFLGLFYYLSFIFLTVITTIITKKAFLSFGIPTFQFLFYRTIASILIILPFILRDRKKLFSKTKAKSFLNISMHAVSIYIWYFAITTVSISFVSLMAFTVPIFVNFLAIIFLDEKVSKKLWIVILVSAVGLMFINKTSIDSSHSLIAIIYALTFVISRSFAIILSKKASKSLTPVESFYFSSIAMVICGLVFLTIYPVKFGKMTFYPIILESLNVALYMLQMYLMYKAFSLSTVSKLQPLEFTKFGFAVIFSHLILGEKIIPIEIFAAIFIFFTNFFLMRKFI